MMNETLRLEMALVKLLQLSNQMIMGTGQEEINKGVGEEEYY